MQRFWPFLKMGICVLALMGCAEESFSTAPQDMGTDADEDTDLHEDAASPMLAEVGETCKGPGECVENALCVGNSSGEFTCMSTCPEAYSTCDDGSVCIAAATGESSICYTGGSAPQGDPCRTNLDCEAGNLCIGRESLFLCHQACGQDEDCDEDELCRMLESGSRVCESRIGRSCIRSSDCPDSEQTCTHEVDSDFDVALPGGMCTFVDCDSASCPTGTVCLTVPGAPSPACIPDCDDDSDCRFTSGYGCFGSAICATFDDSVECERALSDTTVCLPI